MNVHHTKRNRVLWNVSLLFFASTPAAASLALGAPPASNVVAADAAIESWNFGTAAALVGEMEEQFPEAIETRALKARLFFLRHDYMEARQVLGSLCDIDTTPQAILPLCQRIVTALRVTRNFKSVPSMQGHFILHYLPGPEEILVAYATQALEQAYQELGRIFRSFPQDPVHIEIVPRTEAFAALTGMAQKQIEVTGTVAMCKYNKLMIVSPRDLVYGYPWLETLAHEYVHYLVTLRSSNRAPVWLQEGLARFFENRWRETEEAQLSPIENHLLSEAIRNHRLTPLAKLQTSLAQLPSQREATITFLQVFTVARDLFHQKGLDGINHLLARMAEGQEPEAAWNEVTGFDLRQWERAWRTQLESLPPVTLAKAYQPRLFFRGRDRIQDELQAVNEREARNLTYLGDLLRARGRPRAALAEYRKAADRIGNTSPMLQSKIGAALLALTAYDKAVAEVEPVLKYYPNDVSLNLCLGQAKLRQGQVAAARRSLEEVIRLNPFDLNVHRLMAEANEALGRNDEAGFERRQQALLESTLEDRQPPAANRGE